jgi:drug/metabolite transporter (DMT)-like permease
MNAWVFTIAMLILLVFMELSAEILLTPKPKCNKTYNWEFFAGCVVYATIGVVFGFTLRHGSGQVAIVNTIWQCLNIVIVFIAGVLFLGEKAETAHYIGVAVAFLAACIMAYPDISDQIAHSWKPQSKDGMCNNTGGTPAQTAAVVGDTAVSVATAAAA